MGQYIGYEKGGGGGRGGGVGGVVGVFFFQAEDGIRDDLVTGVQTCALPICPGSRCGSAPAFFTDHFSLRQRPRFLYCPFLVAAAPRFYTAPFSLQQRDRKSVV